MAALLDVIGVTALAQIVLDHLAGAFLHVGVERQPHVQHAIIAKLARVGEFLDFLIGVVEIPVRARVLFALHRSGRIALRRNDLAGGHEAGVDKIVQHVVRARARGGKIDVRGVFGRRLEQAGQHRRLGQRHVLHRFAEIELRGRLNAEGAAAHVNPVEIEFENLPLGQMMLEPNRQKGLVDLARHRPLVGEKQIFCELLGDRRAALHHARGARVDGQRPRGADHVDAEMLVKAPILGGEHGLDQIVGILFERHRVVVLDSALSDLDAVAVQKSHREVGPLEPVLLAGHVKRRGGQRQRQNPAAKRHRERLAGDFHSDPAHARNMETRHEGREVLVCLARSAAAVEHAGVDHGVDRQQQARKALNDRQ